MNFKTTLILLLLLVVVGAAILFTQKSAETPAKVTEAKLLDVSAGDVTRVSFTNDDGKITLEKSDGKWRLSEPVKAPAEDYAANGLVEALTSLKSRGKIAADSSTGLDQPRFKVELATKDNKTTKLDVGGKSGAGNNLYVRLNDQKQADVVPAEIYDQLEKPVKDWRREQLFDVGSPQIKQIRVATTQQSIALQQDGEKWNMTQPQKMPVETSEVTEMAIAISGLRAEEFLGPQPDEAKRYGLDQPVLTVEFSTQAPTTQPATQPNFTTVKFGRFDDVLKKNVFASVSGDGGVVKVAATALNKLNKKPLDLRDRKILAIDGDKVTKINIATNKAAATQHVVLERAKQSVGPPTPTTSPATTQAATEPAATPSKWIIASKNGAEADDVKIDQLLTELHALRAERFIESSPTTQPAATITLKIETTDASHEIRLTDPGNAQPLVGQYNGLTFEIVPSLREKLEGDFARKASGPVE